MTGNEKGEKGDRPHFPRKSRRLANTVAREMGSVPFFVPVMGGSSPPERFAVLDSAALRLSSRFPVPVAKVSRDRRVGPAPPVGSGRGSLRCRAHGCEWI